MVISNKSYRCCQMKLRKIRVSDAECYYNLYRNALSEVPLLFLESLEEFEKKTTQDIEIEISVQEKIGTSFILGAFDEVENLVGFIGFRQESSHRLNHNGFILGLYVSQKARGANLGKALINQILKEAYKIPGIKQVKLQLEAENNRAKELYEYFGFEVWGREPNAVRVEGVYYDDYHMILRDLSDKEI